MRTRWVHVDGRDVRLLERGAGPPVVLVHGLGLSAGVWEPHLTRLADAGYRGLAPDLPGFGKSAGPPLGMSISAAADWLLRLADTLALRRAAWVGHSVGTQQVIRLAASAPERVAALVLAAPTGRTGWRAARQPFGLAATAFQEPPALVAGVLKRYLLNPMATLSTWTRATRHDTLLDAPHVSSTTLLVLGESDAVVPDRFVERLERSLPDVETRRIEGASHAVALDPVDEFMDAVLGFLARRYADRSSTD